MCLGRFEIKFLEKFSEAFLKFQKFITVVVKMSQETNPQVGRKKSKNPEKWSRNIGKKARNKVYLVQIIIEPAKKY